MSSTTEHDQPSSTERPLDGRVALVTGASSGIGAAVARQLARAGAAVAVAARRQDRLAALAEEIESEGGRALPITVDVRDEAQCRRSTQSCVERFGRLDVLVNNAGVMLLGPVEGASTDDWRRMVDTDVYGVLYMTHAALPHLLESRGAVVQVSSVDGRTAGALTGVYNASKWAVTAFSESLRQEVTARGVRVVLVEPGATATDLASHITHEPTREAVARFTEAIRPLQPDDVARAVLFALTQPPHVAVNEVLIRSVDQQR